MQGENVEKLPRVCRADLAQLLREIEVVLCVLDRAHEGIRQHVAARAIGEQREEISAEVFDRFRPGVYVV